MVAKNFDMAGNNFRKQVQSHAGVTGTNYVSKRLLRAELCYLFKLEEVALLVQEKKKHPKIRCLCSVANPPVRS